MRVAKKKRYSVLLLYPDYIADTFGETYFDHVKARSPKQAIETAVKRCIETNDFGSVPPTADFLAILILQGWHKGIEVPS